MKTLSIGREPDCDIIINDVSSVVSRRHAVLTISTFGSMTITDLSHNGTYVNGIRISSNVPFPVTRKDNVSFAHVARLNWEVIPNPRKYLYYIIAGVVALLILIGVLVGVSKCTSTPEPAPAPTPAAVDSTNVKEKEAELKKAEEQRQDSIKKAVQDSIKKANEAAVVKKPKAPKTDDKKTNSSGKSGGKNTNSSGKSGGKTTGSSGRSGGKTEAPSNRGLR